MSKRIKESYQFSNQANLLFESGQHEKAIELLQLSIKINPNEAAFYGNLGLMYFKLKKYLKSIDEFSKACSIDTKNYKILRNLGLSYFHLEDYDNAIKYFERSLKINPDDLMAMHDIGLSYFYLKKYRESLIWYDKVLELNPNEFNSLRNKGLLLNRLNSYSKAINYYERALKIKPSDSATLSDLGLVYAQLGKWNDAIELYDKSIKNDNSYDKAHFNKGVALKHKRKFNEALKCFDRTIEINPEHHQAYINKGILLDVIKSGKKKISNSIMQTRKSCYVAFFDILGFRDLVTKNTHEYLKKLYFNEFDFSISSSLSDVNASIIGPIEKAINSMTISDSIIFWTNSDSLESFFIIFRAASALMISSFSMGLPLRGAITIGEISISHGFYEYNQSSIKSSLIGKPLVKAYEMEKQQNWSGCIIDDECINLYLESIKKRNLSEEDPFGISNLINSKLILEYEVPLKENKFEKKYVINWTMGGIFDHYKISEIEKAFSDHKKSTEREDVKIKIINTLEFYKKMKNDC